MGWRERIRSIPDRVERDDIEAAIGELEAAKARLYAELVKADEPQPDPSRLDTYLTAADVADLLAVSEKWAYRNQHELGAVKVGGAVRFPERRVVRYLRARQRAG